MRYYLILEYDGTDFCGWQRQKNGVSVQETVEKALYKAFGAEISVTGSGRTDAGVHAKGQTAHFDADLTLPPEKVREAVNCFLPPSVRIKESGRAAEGFHARFSAKEKTYRYAAYRAETDLPLSDRYFARVKGDFDTEKMRKALETVLGTHDFAAFRSTGSEVKDTVRTISSAALCSEEKEGATFYYLTVTGNGFLYNMVRILAGTLFSVGRGELPSDVFLRAFENKERKTLGKTAPACGLTLFSVKYPEIPEKNAEKSKNCTKNRANRLTVPVKKV